MGVPCCANGALSGQPREAAARLERALAKEPGNGFLLAYLGVAWTLISDPGQRRFLLRIS